MKKNYPNYFLVCMLLFSCCFTSKIFGQSFDQSQLNFNGLGNVSNGVTSLMFGPDGRLYVAEYPGLIKILTIARNSSTDYDVSAIEVLNDIQTMTDHNDDGTLFSSVERETIGLTVVGTASNPVIYVTSSDFRIGAGEGGGNGDVGLDTNSGVITRFSWNGSSWDVVDIVRGLPRSEENHATNGLEFATINGTDYLIVASGGNTNGGSPSTNFVYTCEYALSGAILSINLDMIESMPVLNDNGRSYIYDLPTLDDPTRANVNGITDSDVIGYDGIDINDPWGGNDGLNQAIIDPAGPVQIYSPGFRNAYDIVLTESGALYVTDNGANGGWGGFPANEGGGSATNNYDPAEPGSQSPSGGEQIDNVDHLEMVTTNIQTYTPGLFYGGHPNPVRANPNGAGLFTAPASSGLSGAIFRTQLYDPDGSTPGSTTDPNIGLPANWPPVSAANPIEGDWRGPTENNPDGPLDNPIVTWSTNTNGIDEYTASNFGGAMQGNLLAGQNSGIVRRVELQGDGTLDNLTPNFFSGIGGNPLGITCNGDDEVFPGTVWTGTLGGLIVVFEPLDFLECTEPGEPDYDPLADGDLDGYLNQDEEDNGTQVCNGGSQPSDFDQSVGGTPLVSDLNDDDDDADGILDANDSFQLGNPNITGSDAFNLPVFNALFNDQQGLGGIFGLGMTGLMNNGDTGPNWLDWLDDRDAGPNPNDVLGGATGIMTSHMTDGTALGAMNNQDKGYQYGVQVDNTTGKFTVIGGMNGFTGPLRLYENTDGVTGGELGFFIGDGTQSNYIKFVVTTDGFTVLQEIDDVPGTPIQVTLPVGNRPTSGIRFYFVVDPSTGLVEMDYQIDTNPRTTLGTLTASGTILQAIQTSALDLAVGFIGTSNTPGKELEGSWDFLNVLGEEPIVVQGIPNLDRLIDAPSEDLDLDIYFNDDEGIENLTYTVESNTNPAIGANISENLLTLTFPSIPTSTEITVRATDEDDFFVEDTFLVNVTEGFTVLYRVNAGGPLVPAIDGNLDWGEDTTTNNSQFLSVPATNRTFSGNVSNVDASVDTSTTPFVIFETERFDVTPGIPNLTYSFPVAQQGNYEVRLYMGNGFGGTSEAGERIFDVTIEGFNLPLLENIDLSGTYGNSVGTMITHILRVQDGALDIEFLHDIIENPLINGIEILDAPDSATPIYVHPIADQLSNVGVQLNGSLGVQAIGGDGNLQFAATGLPQGLFIEPTNGQIGGTIEESAISSSPYDVVITVDDSDGLTNDIVTINFTWTVVEAFVYRINAGGSQVNPSDIGSVWEQNASNGAQAGGSYSVNTGLAASFGGITFANRDVSIPAYLNSSTFEAIFMSERFDLLSAPEMEYTLPLEDGDYVVNLYLGNSFNDASEIGNRVFDILIEGAVVENDFDLIERFGHQVGGMVTHTVTVNDGELNISLGHVVENPLINAIEVFIVDSSNPVFTVSSISNQTNDIFEDVDITVSSSGGDAAEVATYYIAGQPDGITIDPSTGQISGIIDVTAATGGPNGDGVHTVVVTVLKPNSAPAGQVFSWTVNASIFWTDLDENEGYAGRHENAFVQAGDKFYMMGGREFPRNVEIYDYDSDSWTLLADSAPFDFSHFQAVEYQGLIWVIGALKTNDFPSETPAEFIWMFDTSSQEWIQGPAIPQDRQRGSSGLVLYNDKFYVVGGNTNGHAGGYVSWFDEFDPATGIWTPLEDAPNARDHFAAVLIGNKLYAAGGRLSGGTGGVWNPTIPEVDVYDFSIGSWETLPSGQNIPTPRGGSSAVNFNNKLVVIGGEVLDEVVYGVLTDDALKITEQYDPVTSSWERLPDMNFERHGTQAIVSGTGVFIAAGAPNRGGGNQQNMEVLGDNSPAGVPNDASVLNVPATVIINDGETVDVPLNVLDGNVGIFIRSVEITGANAADFSIVSGETTNAILNANSTNPLSVSLSGTGEDRTAILTVNYGNSESASIALTNNPDANFEVENPGNQFNYEGDSVSLQIEATSPNNTTYSALGLPPDLTINLNTGVISGTIDDGFVSDGDNNFIEENGLVIIEAESGDSTGWGITDLDGETGIIANTNSLSNQNGSTITYEVTISDPGVYRFNWRSFFSGPSATDENDSWLRFANDDDVWFFGLKDPEAIGGSTDESAIIANLQGAQTNVVFPEGSTRITPQTTPVGNTSNGFFKIFRSGGISEIYDWQALTSDFDGHDIFVWFVNPGTYTMDISERSAGHAIDRVALYKVGTYGYDYNTSNLTNAPESQQGGGTSGPGAAENSPYDVTVTVTDEGDPPGSETIEFIWYIGEPGDLIAAPQADVTEGGIPLTVNFTGSNSLDDVGVTSYLWDFKDGTTSTQADPSHVFEAIGIFSVDLTVGDADGNSDTKSIVITVSETGIAPTAIASSDISSGEAPLLVDFDGSGSTDDTQIASYSWDFGDGGTSSEITPSYTFNEPGIYDVTLTVTDFEGLQGTDVVVITVNAVNVGPTAVAEATPLNGDAPLEVMFTGSNSTDDIGITAYSWDFGDGGASTDANPTYTYTAPGDYDAVLTVIDGGGLMDTAMVTIQVTEPADNEPPLAVVMANPTEGPAPLPVIFNGSGSSDDVAIVSYFWDFKDGTTSSEANPVTTFDIEGVYEVELTVTDEGGLTDTAMVTITVLPGNAAPEAVVEATPLNGDAPLEVSFIGSNSTDDVAIAAYNWDFGDGGSSTEANPVHIYTTPGMYTAELTVTDSDGLMDTATINILVTQAGNEAPVALATADPIEGETPLVVNFDGSTSSDDNGIEAYFWDFKNGATSDEINPITTFEEAGIYEVELTVTDDSGLTDTTTVVITAIGSSSNTAPVAVVEATPLTGDAPLQVSFTGSNSTDDTGIASYLWDFDNGDSSTEGNPTYTFEVAGSYEVRLTVTDAEGLFDSQVITIEVLDNDTFALDMGAAIAPNPTRISDEYAFVYISEQLAEIEVTRINLHDSTGSLLGVFDPNDSNIFEGNRYRIPIFGLRDGLYHVTLEMNEGDPISIGLLVQN